MKYLLNWSLQKNMPITIIYLSGNGHISQREVVVKKLNNQKLFAYCYLRKQIRTFSLTNILSADHIVKSSAV
ncbi:putative DNA-binding transcriptional regulator YafY [Metabacillus crassostreae]|nr:putative DNA-binding transcriptional regulator YafY [Metabacillus crassostreae]